MKNFIFFSILALLCNGCREKFEFPFESPPTGYLVIEGVVNSGNGPATINLSRTTTLQDRALKFENGAQVRMEGENNTSYPFAAIGNGVYSAGQLSLDKSVKYRLRIYTAGKEYLSEFVPVVINPPIDSISVKRNSNGVELLVNTRNPLNNTRYYQWSFGETWEITVPFISSLKIDTTRVGNNERYEAVYRYPLTFAHETTITNCWQYNVSTNLLLGSSARLTEDVIHLPVQFIPNGSRKLSVLYSILLTQYGWTKEGYEYLENLRKNTEQVGSIFDPQPSQLFGNFKCLDDVNEPVIGFFNVCDAQQMRIFVRPRDVGGWSYNTGCYQATIENISDSILAKLSGFIPTTVLVSGTTPLQIIDFSAAPPPCVDCRVLGSNVKPSYWP